MDEITTTRNTGQSPIQGFIGKDAEFSEEVHPDKLIEGNKWWYNGHDGDPESQIVLAEYGKMLGRHAANNEL